MNQSIDSGRRLQLDLKNNNFNLKEYDQDVPKMNDTTYNQILDKGGAFANLENAYFDALLTCTNQDFVSDIKLELTKWDSGATMSFEDIKADALIKYNNICKRLKKDKQYFDGQRLVGGSTATHDSIIPKDTDAKLVALAIELVATRKELAEAQASVSRGSGASFSSTTSSGLQKRLVDISKWRMKKPFGDSVFKDGKQYYWCLNHVYKGLCDGLYVTHPAYKHDEW